MPWEFFTPHSRARIAKFSAVLIIGRSTSIPCRVQPSNIPCLGRWPIPHIPRIHSRNKTFALCRLGTCRRRKCWWSLTCNPNVHDPKVSCKSHAAKSSPELLTNIWRQHIQVLLPCFCLGARAAKWRRLVWVPFQLLLCAIRRSRISPQKSRNCWTVCLIFAISFWQLYTVLYM